VSTTPIADHGLLSDSHGSALVTRAGSVDWLCFDRFDSAPVFCRLLDDHAGHWSIAPVDAADITRRYVEDTMVLATTFRTASGVVTLEDGYAVGDTVDASHEVGGRAPGVLVRRVVCREGAVRLGLEYAPRPEYGLISPLLHPVKGGLRARGGANVLMLSGRVPLDIERSTARAEFDLETGEQRTFALSHGWSWGPPPTPLDEEEADRLLDETIRSWRTWSRAHEGYDGPWRDLVRHSGRVLQALTFRPTGAMVAAATTSLPEAIGGARNWDYRYAWVRDASFTLQALGRTACPAEAHHFFAWLAGATAESLHTGAELQIMFGIGGEHDLSERELPHLSGYRGSRPVRVGNGAWDQRQLDVYGELLDAAASFRDQFDELDEATLHFLADVADAAAERWRDDDEGIWEVRGGRKHFLYSKLMCWVAVDRAIGMAKVLGAADRVERWRRVREEIRRAIFEQGWNDAAGAFTQSFGSADLDASALMMPIVGFIEPDDSRMLATIDAIDGRLTDDRGLVYRYRSHDGLDGEEGTFLLCTFWLAQAQAMAGRLDDARATFERAAGYANDIGLLAEEVDSATGELLGNFPQAFSHIGLVNAAGAIASAEARQAGRELS
jgi:GH15 family glucan-1,4-alpha-glucosidase